MKVGFIKPVDNDTERAQHHIRNRRGRAKGQKAKKRKMGEVL